MAILAFSTGWKLLGGCVVALLVAGAMALVTAYREDRRAVMLRRGAGWLALVALVTAVVVLIVGPGDFCQPGDAYHVWGCA